jgi:hypothetical protein
MAAVKEHLQQRLGDDPREATERAEEMHLLTKGAAGPTLMALTARLNRAWLEDG